MSDTQLQVESSGAAAGRDTLSRPVGAGAEGSAPQVPERPAAGRWLWLGLHGGAGVTTLAHAVPGGVDVGGLHGKPPSLPVVAVCRSHAGGLGAAQEWAAAWAARQPYREVLGLVVVADAPGPLPRGLKLGIRLVSGGFRQLWRVPWVPAWRVGQPVDPQHLPTAIRRLADDLAAKTAPRGGM